MKWYHYVICFVLIVVGIFSCFNLVKIINLKSGEYGKAITIETKNDYVEVSKFDFGALVLTDTDDYVNYSLTSTFGVSEFNGKEKDYLLLFNGKPVSNVVSSAGKISGDFIENFYDLDSDVSSIVKLHILIEYYASGTKVTLSLTNQNNSISYLTNYAQVNGAVIKVVERSLK